VSAAGRGKGARGVGGVCGGFEFVNELWLRLCVFSYSKQSLVPFFQSPEWHSVLKVMFVASIFFWSHRQL